MYQAGGAFREVLGETVFQRAAVFGTAAVSAVG